jgi:hypothetical protein
MAEAEGRVLNDVERLEAGRRAIELRELWTVAENVPGGPSEAAATISNPYPSEEDGSMKHWRGYHQLLRQRKAVELDNPEARRRMLDGALRR